MTVEPTIDRALVQQFLEVQTRSGHYWQPSELEAMLGPDAATRAVFGGEQIGCLFESIMRRSDDIYLGFIEPSLNVALDSAVHTVVARSTTFEDSVWAYTTTRHAIRKDIRYSLDYDRKRGIFTFARSDDGLIDEAFHYPFYWYILSRTYRAMCWHIGKVIKLSRVSFRCPKPPYATRHPFNCAIAYDQDHDGFSFPLDYLNSAMLRTEEQLIDSAFTISGASNWLIAPGEDDSLYAQVETVVDRLLGSDATNPSIDAVAAHLRLTTRLLRRRLSREGENFMAIKDRVRARRAKRSLLSSHRPIYAVSQDLGFKEPGDFTRTFKRWTGLTPSEYRRQASGPTARP